MIFRRTAVIVSVLFAAGCPNQVVDEDTGAEISLDGGPRDTGVVDDTGIQPDAGFDDGAVIDTGPEDAGFMDALVRPDGGQPMGVQPEPRFGHRMSVLGDGRLLITGGQGTQTSQEETWFFHPDTLTFTEGATLSPPRTGHSASVLPDGRLLVAGGLNNLGGINRPHHASALLFDPASDSWTETGTLSEPRCCHAAIPLTTGPNAGKVLIAGGGVDGERVLDMEVYDPALGAFSKIGVALPEIRDGAAYVVLADGRILIAGGAARPGTFDVRDSAYLFDPVTGEIRLTAGVMSKPRTNLRGYLLSDGTVLIFPGTERGGTHNDSEIFDPATEMFTAGPVIVSDRQYYATTRLSDGRIFLFGGSIAGAVTDTVEVYEEGVGFAPHPGRLYLPLSTTLQAITLPGDIVFLLGGSAQNGFVLGEPRLFYP